MFTCVHRIRIKDGLLCPEATGSNKTDCKVEKGVAKEEAPGTRSLVLESNTGTGGTIGNGGTELRPDGKGNLAKLHSSTLRDGKIEKSCWNKKQDLTLPKVSLCGKEVRRVQGSWGGRRGGRGGSGGLPVWPGSGSTPRGRRMGVTRSGERRRGRRRGGGFSLCSSLFLSLLRLISTLRVARITGADQILYIYARSHGGKDGASSPPSLSPPGSQWEAGTELSLT